MHHAELTNPSIHALPHTIMEGFRESPSRPWTDTYLRLSPYRRLQMHHVCRHLFDHWEWANTLFADRGKVVNPLAAAAKTQPKVGQVIDKTMILSETQALCSVYAYGGAPCAPEGTTKL